MSERRPATLPAGASAQGEALVARTGRAAVDLLERLLCGDAAVPSASIAEGRALAGDRAASLLGDGPGSPPAPGRPEAAAAWVHHRLRRSGPAAGNRFPVRLEARTAQQALDLSLVAHLVAARLGRPVACSMEEADAEGVHLLHLPAPELLEELLAGQDGHPLVEPDSKQLRELVETALQAVAQRTGRPLEAAGLFTGEEPPNLRWIGAAPPHLSRPTGADQSLVLAAMPAGEWSERLLLAAAAALGRVEPLSLHRPRREPVGCSAIVLHAGDGRPDEDSEIDLLFVAHPGLLSRRDLLAPLAPNGVVLTCARGGALALATGLPRRLRERVREGELDLRLVDPWAALDGAVPDRTALRRALEGALIAAAPWPEGLGGPRPERLSEAAAAAGEERGALLRAGGESVVKLDAASLEPPLSPPDPRPLVPSEPGAKADEWRPLLRHFHLTGEGAWSAAEQLPALPLWPTELEALLEREPQAEHHPRCADLEEGRVEPAKAVLERAFESARRKGRDLSLIEEHLPLVVDTLETVLAERLAPCPAGEAFSELVAALPARYDLSADGLAKLEEQLQTLLEELPSVGELLGFSATAVPLLHLRAIRRALRPARAELLAELDSLCERLRTLLGDDPGQGERSLAATLGGSPRPLIDADALARTVPARRGTRELPAELRELARRALGEIERGRARLAEEPEVVVVTAEPIPVALAGPEVRELRHPDAAQAAVGVFDGLVAPYEDLLRARRLARRLVDGSYDPVQHQPMLQRFGWEGFEIGELLAVPRVVVLERGGRLRGGSLSSFSSLLRSARPIHLLVSEDASGLMAGETWEALAGYHRGLGHLAVAHREAFVTQGSLARPDHLVESLERMARCLRPAVAVVALPWARSPVAGWAQAVAALHGRATPCFRHDPEAGESWADRFDLEGNVSPEAPWPIVRHAALTPEGKEQELESAFTFAHAAALAPSHRRHFRLVPAEAWGEDQVELGRWLAGGSESLSQLPYIWVRGEGAELQRAILTRELAFACRDRLEAWHVLQELAGTDNEHARRAAAASREQALLEAAEREVQLQAEHEAELAEVRRGAAREAMERLAAVLLELDLDAASLPAAPRPAAARPAPSAPAAPEREATPAPPEPEPAEAEEEDDDELVLDEPFVETVLCTSCNECINLNPKLFVYDENKQAHVGDPSAGTYAQLVSAAEKCPARCIHPGKPRAGDDTATPELIERAARFQ